MSMCKASTNSDRMKLGVWQVPRINARLECWALGPWPSELAKGVECQKGVDSSDASNVAHGWLVQSKKTSL